MVTLIMHNVAAAISRADAIKGIKSMRAIALIYVLTIHTLVIEELIYAVHSVKHLTTLGTGIMLVAVIGLAGGSDERHRMGVHIRTTAAAIHTAIAILTQFVRGICTHTRRTGLQIHTFTAILQAVAAIITEIVCGHIITAGIAESLVICSRTSAAVLT